MNEPADNEVREKKHSGDFWFAVGFGLFNLGIGTLLVLIIGHLEQHGDAMHMPAWAAFFYLLLGKWGIFGVFAGVGGFLLLGALFHLGDRFPFLGKILHFFGVIFLVFVLPVGGIAGSVACYGSGHWVWGSILALAGLFGLMIVLAEIGLGKLGADLIYYLIYLIIFGGMPVGGVIGAVVFFGEGRWGMGLLMSVIGCVGIFLLIGLVQNWRNKKKKGSEEAETSSTPT